MSYTPGEGRSARCVHVTNVDLSLNLIILWPVQKVLQEFDEDNLVLLDVVFVSDL